MRYALPCCFSGVAIEMLSFAGSQISCVWPVDAPASSAQAKEEEMAALLQHSALALAHVTDDSRRRCDSEQIMCCMHVAVA